MDFFRVLKLPRVHDAQWIVFSFKYRSMALCMILMDSSSLSSPFLFVSSTYNILLRTLSSSFGAICFKIFSRWRDKHWLRKTFVHSLFCGTGRILNMFIYSDRALLLLRFILPETWEHLPFWDGSEVVFVRFSFVYVSLDSVSYGSWVDVEKKSPTYSSKWTLKVWNFP